MDLRYEDIYNSLYYSRYSMRDMPPPFFEHPATELWIQIRIAIEEVAGSFQTHNPQIKIRPDAKYFLLVSFYEIVAIPLGIHI